MAHQKKHVIKVKFYLNDKDNISTEEINKIFKNAMKVINEDSRFELSINYLRKVSLSDFNDFSHLTFFKIQNDNHFFLFLSGYQHARKTILLNITDASYDLPPAISNTIFYTLPTNQHKDAAFNFKIQQILRTTIDNYFNFNNFLTKIWFTQSHCQEKIYILGGPDEDIEQKGNNVNAPDISQKKLDSSIYDFGDKDTFIDCCVFLSKYLNNAILERYESTKINFDEYCYDNLVVIGGPGSEKENGNIFCEKMMDKMNSCVSYKPSSINDEKYYLQCQDFEGHIQINSARKITKDYGYFACFTNPFDSTKNSRVILINGIHTPGVLGAFKAFSDAPNNANFKTLSDKAIKERLSKNEMLEFECFFEVIINTNNEPEVPNIKPENIFFFNESKQSSNGRKNKVDTNGKKLKSDMIKEINIAKNGDTSGSKDIKPAYDKLIEIINKVEESNVDELIRIKKVLNETNINRPQECINKIIPT